MLCARGYHHVYKDETGVDFELENENLTVMTGMKFVAIFSTMRHENFRKLHPPVNHQEDLSKWSYNFDKQQFCMFYMAGQRGTFIM